MSELKFGTSSVISGENGSLGGAYARVAHFLTDTFGIQRDWRVLDVGCCYGDILHDIDCADRVGVDELDRAHYDDVTMHVTDATQGLPFKDGELDLAFSHGMIQLCQEAGGKAAVEELERVGKRTAIMDCPYLENMTEYNSLRKQAGKPNHWGYSPKWFADRGYSVTRNFPYTFNHHLKFNAVRG